MTTYDIEIYPDAKGEYRFRIKHKNGRVVADSAESYKRKFFCRRNAENLQEKLHDSKIIEKI